jgi:predicted AlkP superfamily pyrophosphatase or phosphodiesterase
MIGRLFRAFALLAFLAAAPAAAKAPQKPGLIVTLVVDQFAADLFRQYRPTYTGGLKRLSDGVAYLDGYQSHAATETCPGHSTILTGRHPAATGIVANNWYDRASGEWLYCVALPGGDSEARGPRNLRVDTLGTWLKASEPAAQVVAVSGKDRAAIMLAGHHPDAVYWWEDDKGFVTSPAAGPADAAVLAPAEQFDSATFAAWNRAAPALWPAAVPGRCRALEKSEQFGEITRTERVPPEGSAVAPADEAFADQLRVSPMLDRLTLDFAARLVELRRLGRDPATDLLAVSLSATDAIGHRYGKGGPEMCAQMVALDQALGAFFARLDALDLPYVVVLTADHGSSDAAEREASHGVAAGRIDGRALIASLNTHLDQAYGPFDHGPVSGSAQNPTLDVGPDRAFKARVLAEAVSWLGAQQHVAQVLTRDEVAAAAPAFGTPPDRLTMAERFHESYDPQRSGDLFVVFDEHYRTGVPRKPSSAIAGHGTPWDYDRLVPILFWWPGVTAETVTRPIETVDIAPTLAAVAGVRTPLLDGRCLPEVADCAAK